MDPLTPEDRYTSTDARDAESVNLRRENQGLRAHLHRLREAALLLCEWASQIREYVPGADEPSTDDYAACQALRDAEEALRTELRYTLPPEPTHAWVAPEAQELRDRITALESRQGIAHCGCELRHEKPENIHGGWYELGHYDGEPRQWLRACELHRRYGFHREMVGFDEGISK